MKLVVAIACIVCVCGPLPGHADAPMAGNIDLVKAARWFAEFDSLCARDAGALWGVSLDGPILFVDPATRSMVANREDAEHLLTPRAGVFVGTLPAGLPVANTAIDWQGIRWTLIMWWSLSDKERPRLSLMGHESFHRLQPQLGLEAPGELNDHLDTADGRYWMQMEWNALQQALLATGDARRTEVSDALLFRAARRMLFPNAADREIALEIHEGLPEYTGRRLAGYTAAEIVDVVAARRKDESGFVRSFAYTSGPLYGYLLDAARDGWGKEVSSHTDLGEQLSASMGIARAAPAAASGPRAPTDEQIAAFIAEANERAQAYGGAALRAGEIAREHEREAQRAAWRRELVEGPVLIVNLSAVRSGTFDPHKVYPLGDQQTVYTTRGLEAAWGVLKVEDGAILEDRTTGEGHVSLAGAAADYSKGTGWRLTLADGWHVVPGERPGDVRVAKE